MILCHTWTEVNGHQIWVHSVVDNVCTLCLQCCHFNMSTTQKWPRKVIWSNPQLWCAI